MRTVDSWTRDSVDAHNFMHSEKAIAFAQEYGLDDVYVTVKFLGGDPEVAVPLPAHIQPPRSQARLY